jgi:hypothetical protein
VRDKLLDHALQCNRISIHMVDATDQECMLTNPTEQIDEPAFNLIQSRREAHRYISNQPRASHVQKAIGVPIVSNVYRLAVRYA